MNKTYKILKFPVIIYGLVIAGLIVLEQLSGFVLSRISRFAGYSIADPFPEYTKILLFRFIFLLPLAIDVLLLLYVKGDAKGFIYRICNTIIRVFGITIIVILGVNIANRAEYLQRRYNHIVTKGNERFRPTELTSADFRYFENGKVRYSFAGRFEDNGEKYIDNTAIVYIYDKDNPDVTVESYISEIITEQPLKLYKLEKGQAAEVMLHNKIKIVPALIMIVDNNNDVMVGFDEISMLETKIHNYKQHNIFFY